MKDPKKSKAGKIGGKAKNPNKGFGSNRELASRVGRIGGLVSRKKKTKNAQAI